MTKWYKVDVTIVKTFVIEAPADLDDNDTYDYVYDQLEDANEYSIDDRQWMMESEITEIKPDMLDSEKRFCTEVLEII